ncbi:unnamed protein product [Clonostachys rosea f. rosea IK726]|uniref:Uncharacterized protein n=1 Tax=Clonostachys rosea f. rosea IK726 TaxID=1349383 RepID=A0ACA9UUH9_BIOOC|nr:unnamed protein product [Clonostachys rosea f. rosea IK726]
MGSPNTQNESNGFDSGGLTPLAVVGMSLRFPQDATDAPSFWKMLMEQRCASTEVPPERFNMDAHYHPDSSRRETTSVRKGHFLSGDIGAWDAPFFNITASEADAMDPGQRLTLETAFHALESAGIPIPTIAGTKTSVYSATFMRDYDYLHNNDPDDQPKYLGLGTSPNMLSNRVSWFFDLRGPSGSVDTACSSSLLALDLVCQSIWSGDANMGLACGSNIMLTPFTTVSLDNLGLLGKDGRCFSFDHRANGYARGEGVAVVVVKPLKDALRDGDTIRAVIRSSSSNQDGKTPTITQPSREAQERLILAAHAKAGLDLGETRYFEAHGTGTPVGDPIETRSIGAAYRRFRSPDDPLYVGSVKSNIGHLEGAAGLAGVMKTILALEAGIIPPQTNFERLNPAIDAEFLNIKIPINAVPWPTKGLRRASVQSFGLGGSNSHVILDDAHNFLQQRGLSGHHNTITTPPALESISLDSAPISPHDNGIVNGARVTNGIKTVNGNGAINGAPNGINGINDTNGTNGANSANGINGNHTSNDTNGIESDKDSEKKLLVWSATDQDGIVRLKSVWRDYLAKLRLCPKEKSQFIRNLAYTLSSRRTHFSHRAFAVFDMSDDLTTLVGKFSSAIRGSATPKLAYIFSGQGSQWYAMGRELFYRYPIYRKSVVDASVYLQGLDCPWDAVDELMRGENDTNVNDAEYSQPLCTIIQVALVDLLNSFGLRPAKVVGHSSGEIAAAYCAGALSRHSAWKIAYLRGLLAARLTSTSPDNIPKVKGSMMALGLPEAEANKYLEQVADQLGSKRLVVACVNSPLNVTISGEESHIDHLKKLLDAASALVIPSNADGIEVNLHMRPKKNNSETDAGWFDFSLYEREESSQSGWKENCNGSIQLNYTDEQSIIDDETDHLGVKKDEVAWEQSRLTRIQKIRGNCTEAVEPDKLYEKLLSSGYNYGPSFQGITSMSYDGKDSSVATVKTYRWSDYFEGPDPGAEHVVHPTTLDAILHTMLASLNHGGTEEISTTIPTFVEHMWISASHGLSSTEVDAVNVVTTGQKYGRRDARSSLTVTALDGQTVLVDVANFQTTVVAGDGGQSNEIEQSFKPGYTLDWKPDLTLLSSTELQEFCDESTLDVVQPSKVSDQELVTFLTISMARTLEMLEGHHQPETDSNYVRWMRGQIKRLNNPTLTQLDDAAFEQMASNIESRGPRGRILAAIARNQVSFLKDETCNGNFPTLANLAGEYIDNAFQAPFFDKLCTLLDCMAHKKLNLRILELGTGSLSLADRILTTLNTRDSGIETTAMPRFASYEYTTESHETTDVSKSNFKGPSAKVSFKTLNIDQDAENQGFELGSYDIILASGGFQNLLDDLNSVKNARKLLKPGGKLIAIEAPRHNEALLANFVFGLGNDWWLGPEKCTSVLSDMNQQHCAEVLSSAKFSGLDVVLRDSHDPALQNFSIVATTAVEDNDVLDSHKIEMPNGSRLFLIHHDDDTEQESIARQIQALIGDSQNTDFFDIQVASVTSAVDLSPFSQDTMIVFLLELGAPVWYTMDEKLYNKLQKLLVSNINSKMLWVGQNGSAGGGDGPELNQSAYRLIDGLSRALNSENDGEILSLLSLQQEGSLSARQMSHILAIIQKVHAQSDEYPDTEWVEKDGRLCVPRMVQSPSLKDKVSSRLIPQRQVQQAWNEGNGLDERVPLKLAFGTPGLLNTLHFVEDKEYSTSQLGEDELEIEVRAVGVNYRDVLSALGRLKNAQVGCECAGILTQVGSGVVSYQVGDRVAAISPIDCYRTYLRVDHRFTARIPDSMPLNIAAAMIINHLTAWWTLHELAHLAPDETVLVHSGAGGTGQAAVQVAQHIGAQVLATVGTEEKKALLKEQYGIDSDHIFSSRVASAFSRGVQRTTKDQGVDVILSALSGEGFISSWECLAPFGRFMEIGKRNIHERKSLPMARFDTGVSFHAFDIGVVCKSRPNTVRPMLEQLFDLHEKGVLRPAFPLQVHGVSDLEKVLRVMQRGDNMGKIVIEMRPEDKVKAVLDRKPTTSLRSDAAYMVAGGLGGLGRSMAAWLVDRGARHLILLARSGPRTQEARDFVESLTLRGVQVATPPCNISDADALRSVLDNCSSTMPPIRGAIQATGLLRDAIFERMSYETWQAAAAPKTLGSWNMHSLLPADMDFFIGISSVAGVAGGRGQANYAAANTYIDALMKYRVDQGLHGVALDLGVFLDIGFATENADLWARWEAQRALTVTEADLFALLDCCCSERIPTQVVYGINSFVQDPSIRHQFFRKAMLRTLALEDEEESGNSGGAGKQIAQDVDFGSVFAQTITLDDAASAVNEALLRKLSTMLALPRDQLDPDTPLHTYGVDSLVAVELRNWFAKEVHAELAIFDILGGATTRSASTLAAVKSRLKKGSWEETKV